VAPEDLRCGDFIAVLNVILELPSFLWCDSMAADSERMVRVRCFAWEGGMPLKVMEICLPFVLVKSPSGMFQSIDVRQVELVRLNKRYAKTTWHALRTQSRRATSLPLATEN
jgi:hypothetical protein